MKVGIITAIAATNANVMKEVEVVNNFAMNIELKRAITKIIMFKVRDINF